VKNFNTVYSIYIRLGWSVWFDRTFVQYCTW